MSEQRTHAEIIEEMRRIANTPRNYTIPDGYGAYKTVTVDSDKWLTEHLDELEAAHKREVVALRTRVDMLSFGIEQYRQYHAGVVKEYESKFCNTAKLREAVDYCRDEVADLIHDIGGYEEDMERRMKELVSKCNAALAAPARNCDLYKTKEKAQEAFVKEPCDHPCGNCWVEDINNECGVEWLLAPATEQKGEGDGNE